MNASVSDAAIDAAGDPVEWLADLFALATDDLKIGLAEVRRHYEAARLDGLDERAQLLACMAICMTISDFSSFTGIAAWADGLTDGQLPAEQLTPHARLIYAGGAIALHQFAPDSVGIPPPAVCIDLFRATLEESRDTIHPNVLIATVEHVFGYLSNTGEQALLGQMHGLADAALGDPRLDAKMRGRWLFWAGVEQWHIDQRATAEALWQRALAAPAAVEWPWLRFHMKRVLIRPLLEDGSLVQAGAFIDELEALLDFARPLDLSDYHHLRGWQGLASGNTRLARQHFELAVEAARRAGMSSSQVSVIAGALAQCLLCDGREDDSMTLLDRVNFPAGPRGDAQRAATIAFCNAAKARRLGTLDYADHLTIGFRNAREQGMVRVIRYAPWMAAQFCSDALRLGIEREFVMRMVEQRRLQAPAGAGPTWPWRVKIMTCQPFGVIVDGQPLELDGKTRTKPLALLRLLSAQAGGPVSVARVCDWLWPDQDPAQARGSFDVTLNRLRAMLKYKDALIVGDGRVGLSEQLVWLDTRALTQAARICSDSLQIADQAQRRPLFEQLLQCHERPFLEVDDEEHWAVEARARYANAFAHAIESLVRAAESDGRSDEANWMRERSGLRPPPAPPLRLVINR